MKKLPYKLQRFLRDNAGLVTREDYFTAIVMTMFLGGVILGTLVFIYIGVSVFGGIIETIITITLSIALIFVLGLVGWIIAYIFGWG